MSGSLRTVPTEEDTGCIHSEGCTYKQTMYMLLITSAVSTITYSKYKYCNLVDW